jgi:hypothetical protein
MHQTTVRFSADLWAQLELEAERSGVSAAQYVRDATLARISYAAGQRGEPSSGRSPDESGAQARSDATETISGSMAVWAQARLARDRARELRDASRATQATLPTAEQT